MTCQDHINYNCIIEFDDGSTNKVYSQWLSNQELCYWKEWSCDAGIKRIYIDVNEEVYGGVCHNDYLGNLQDGWAILDKRTICRKERCSGNTDDLVIFKQQINKE